MEKALQYYKKINEYQDEVISTQLVNIYDAAKLCFNSFVQGGSLFVFGASHAGIITEEMYCRAGGLIVINPLFNPTLMLNTSPFSVTSHMERLEGFGNVILDNSNIKSGDVLIIHSVSGRNSVAIDMALNAVERGIKVIAITNLKYSKSVESRHSSKKRLFEIADLCIDNIGEIGDACITLKKQDQKAAASSTVIGAFIANMISLSFIDLCEQENIEAPVFDSANYKPDPERQERFFEKYENQIHYK